MVVSRRSSVVGGRERGDAAPAAPDARGAPQGYRDLDVYKRSFGLLKPLHQLVLSFPDYEKYDLGSQLRRASKSIPANIGEGYALRDAPKLFCKHLRIAYGSASEVRVHLDVASELGYVAPETHNDLAGQFEIVAKQLFRLWQHWRQTLGVAADEDS
jgi:four helix bundle protein